MIAIQPVSIATLKFPSRPISVFFLDTLKSAAPVVQVRRQPSLFLECGFIVISVYCHMTGLGECGGAGWTMVMKIDGRKVHESFQNTNNFLSL